MSDSEMPIADIRRPFMRELASLKRLWQMAGDLRAPLFMSVLFRFCQSLSLGLAFAVVIWVIVGLSAGQLMTPGRAGQVTLLMVLSLAGQLGFSFLSVQRAWDVSFQMGKHLRLALMKHLARLPMGFHLARHKGDSLTLLTADIAVIEGFLSDGLAKVVQAVALPTLALLFMATRDWVLALSMLGSICIAVPAAVWIGYKFAGIGLQRQDVQARAGGVMVEYMQGIDVIRAFDRIAQGQARFKTALDSFRDISVKMVLMLALPMITFVALVMLGLPLVALVASYRLEISDKANLITAMVLMFSVYGPLVGVVAVLERIRIAEASLLRLDRVLLAAPLPEQKTAQSPDGTAIVFDAVGFSYDGQTEVLHDINFVVPPQSMTAIVGPSGSGKSTILSLLSRFWDIDCGAITIGGADLRHMQRAEHSALISVVFQDVYLFAGSIRSNIAAGQQGADTARIEAAAKAAQAHDFICDLPDGYDTDVGEGGTHLSGGERQRISIARAILKDAPIILLDEATAALDPGNDLAIQRALATLVAQKTLIVVAHKLSTIQAADQILVLDNGRIIERGTHDTLITQSGLYARMTTRKNRAGNWRASSGPQK